MCPMLQKTKTQNVRVWSKENLLIKEGLTERMGDLVTTLRKYRVQASFMQGKKTWEGHEVIDNSRNLDTSWSSRDCETSLFLVCWL